MKWLTFIWLLSTACAQAQPSSTPPKRSLLSAADSAFYVRYMAYADSCGLVNLSLADRTVQTALFFVNTPYVGGLLNHEPETLVVNLRQLDCVTLIDNVLALIASCDEQSYLKQLSQVRYRGGKVSFAARLHYSSDWIYEMERLGKLQNISKRCGGIRMSQHIDFMTTHADLYRPFSDSLNLKAMQQVENAINTRLCEYIPKEKLNETDIQSGDILLFVTTLKGLDTSHVGIAYWQQNNLYFIHASSAGKRVMISDKTLKEYLKSMNKMKGIIVGRLTEKIDKN